MPSRKKQSQLPEHSQAWWEGYACHEPRIKNPYNFAVAPGLYNDWLEGWTWRFHGEQP
jgi:hypothetical protein